jgi:hypothetical protein
VGGGGRVRRGSPLAVTVGVALYGSTKGLAWMSRGCKVVTSPGGPAVRASACVRATVRPSLLAFRKEFVCRRRPVVVWVGWSWFGALVVVIFLRLHVVV